MVHTCCVSVAPSFLDTTCLCSRSCSRNPVLAVKGMSRLALAIVLLFVLQRDMATWDRTATEIARMLWLSACVSPS